MNDYPSLNHTKWDCKYHVEFISKRRRKQIYGALRKNLGEIFQDLTLQKESEIVEAHPCSDHKTELLPGPGRPQLIEPSGGLAARACCGIRLFTDLALPQHESLNLASGGARQCRAVHKFYFTRILVGFDSAFDVILELFG